MSNITIVGAGYVGIVTGATFAYVGNNVTYLDIDEKKVRALCEGAPPIHEPGLPELLQLVKPRLRCTTRYSEAVPNADFIFICVGTPPSSDGNPDLRYVQDAATQIGLHLGPGYTQIINKSTVPIGSGNWVESIVRDAFLSRNGHRPDGQFSVASNPEFLKEGSALADSFFPDRIVVGARDPKALNALTGLYRPLTDQAFNPPAFLPRPEGLGAVPLLTTDLASAELIKYAANAFLATKISFINEIGYLAEKVGADVAHISRGIGLDSRIGHRFLSAGLGWGGSCFGKDTAALVALGRDYNALMPIVSAARDVNCRMREWAVDRLQQELKILKGRTVGILGVSFKPNTDDIRDAPALDIAMRLIGRGAKVRAHDPVALTRARSELLSDQLRYCSEAEEVFTEADAVIVATEWQDYRDLPWNSLRSKMNIPFVLDGRNCLDSESLESFGFRYVGVGR